ncbi:MAG: stage III sporulation protein AD [Oscillospiraceae bacterium]|nr:stage III sporulation protein AD [Oscillospiraceae bacterium]MBQ7082596.1 stage III sporulation protein AD [Oscillospiraceae bacterium]
MQWIQFIGIGLIGMILAVLFRQHKPEYAPLISLAAGLAVVFLLLGQLEPIFSQMEEILQQAGIGTEYIAVLLKSLGICYITQLAADTCRDAGESAIASKMELAGKITVLTLAVPYFTGMLQTVGELIRM